MQTLLNSDFSSVSGSAEKLLGSRRIYNLKVQLPESTSNPALASKRRPLIYQDRKLEGEFLIPIVLSAAGLDPGEFRSGSSSRFISER